MKKILLGFLFIVMIYNHSFANEKYIFQANNQETLGGFLIGNNGEITYKVIDNTLGKTYYVKGGIKGEYFTNVWGFKYLNNNNYIYFANDENGKLYYVYNGIKSIGYENMTEDTYSDDLKQYGFFVKKDGYYLSIINGIEGKKTEIPGKIAFGNNNYAYSIIENGKVYIIKNGEYFEENYGKQYDGNTYEPFYLDILSGEIDNRNGITMKSKVGYEKAFGLYFSDNGDFIYNIGIGCENGIFCSDYGFIKNGERYTGNLVEYFFSNNGKDFYYKRLWNNKVELYKNFQLIGSYDMIGNYIFSRTNDFYAIVKNGTYYQIIKNGELLDSKKFIYIRTLYLTTNNELIYIAINDKNKNIIIKDNIKIGEYDYIDLNIKLNKSDIFYIVKNNISDLNNSTDILYKNGEKIDEGKYILHLNLYGDYYFYIKYENNGIYSLFINGKEQKKYTGNDFGIEMNFFGDTIPIILNDFLYFYNNGNLVSINLNKINENIENNSNIETEKTETTPIQEIPKTTQANPQLDKILAPFFKRTDKKGDEIAKNTYKTVISKIDIVLQKKLSLKNKNILNYLKEKLEEKIK